MRDSPARLIENSQEEALYLFCKQMLKSRLFKGFYKERCYIDAVKGYRDQIIVHRSEKDLKLILEDIERRLRQYFADKWPVMWIGITSSLQQSSATDICLWVELDELAFDHYWFSIKSFRLRDNEVIIKLKPVRLVEAESEVASTAESSFESKQSPESIGFQDFVRIFVNWGASTKQALYEFMSKDISKENLAAVFKFLILLCISLLSLTIEAIRFLGMFTIYFMVEFRKILAVSTPIIMRVIDLCGKIIGGLYILIAMIWRDVKGNGALPAQQLNRPAIAYNRPIYQRIKNEKISQKGAL